MTPLLRIVDYAAPIPESIGPGASLADAHRMMRAYRIRHLPVLSDHRLVGIVSQRDLLLLETLDGVDPEKVRVEEAMNATPYVVKRDTPLQLVATHLWKNKIGSAVVVDDGKVVGIFTTTDALRVLVELLAKKPARPAKRQRPGAVERRAAR